MHAFQKLCDNLQLKKVPRHKKKTSYNRTMMAALLPIHLHGKQNLEVLTLWGF